MPPLWPGYKNFLNTLNQKISGEGAQPPPQTPSSVGRGHPLPTLHPIGASNLASLALAPFHKILNTPLSTSHPAEEKSSLKGTRSGSREQFLHCGLRKFRHSKSSVYRWYTTRPSLVCLRHLRQWQPTRSRHALVHIVHDTLPPTKPPTLYHHF